jgi:putative transposase
VGAAPESARRQQDRRLKVLVRASFEGSQRRYGSPRIHRDLREEHDKRVSRKRVLRLMQEEGLKARQPTRFICTTDSDHDLPVATNLLNREFTAAVPNQRWVGDTTEFTIGESGKWYLAAILDLFSRFVVGWAVSAVNDRHLALAALTMALNRRRDWVTASLGSRLDVRKGGHQDRLAAHDITCSMSRTGDCYDNAVMEAFFSTLKTELADQFNSHSQAKGELFDYIEAFYNRVSYCPTRLCA